MKYLVVTAKPNTTYTHFEVEAESPEEATRKVELVVDGYVAESVVEIGVGDGPGDEPVEILDVTEI